MPAYIEAPSLDERILFLGANGSGKSTLARAMLALYPRWTVIDPKHGFDPMPNAKGEKDWVIIDDPQDRRWQRDKVLYRPRPEYMESKWMAFFFRRLYVEAQRNQGKPEKGRVCYLDEGKFGVQANSMYWQWLSSIAVTTRSFHTLGFWYASQRVAGIPVEVRTEAWRIYVFFLKSKRDRVEVVDLADDLITEQQLRNSTENYHFLEIRRGEGGRAHICKFPPVPAELAA